MNNRMQTASSGSTVITTSKASASMSLGGRAAQLYRRVGQIADTMRGDGNKGASDYDSPVTLNAVLNCLQETYELCCQNLQALHILGEISDGEPKAKVKPSVDNILSVARLISGRLSMTHQYLAGFIPDLPARPEQDAITDHILFDIAFSEMLVERIENGLKELV